ncbi:MAG: WD40 repeat domain-containing protein [Mariniblastus sp.]
MSCLKYSMTRGLIDKADKFRGEQCNRGIARALTRSFVICIVVCIGCSCLQSASGQDSPKKRQAEEKSSDIFSAEDIKSADAPKLLKRVEPGVFVYGRAHRFAEVGGASSFDSSPDGRTLAFGGSKIKLFDLKDNLVTEEIGEANENYQNVVYSPDGRYVLGSTRSSKAGSIVRVFDAIDGSSVGTIATKTDESGERSSFYIQGLNVSADASYVVIWSHNQLQVRDVESGELIHEIKKLGYCQGAAFSADEQQLFFSKSGRLAVIDLKTGKELSKSESKLVGQPTQTIAVNLARNLVAVPGGGGIAIMDPEKDELVKTIPMPAGGYAQSASFSDDGSLIAASAWLQSSGHNAMHLVILDVDRKKLVRKVKIASAGQLRCRFSTDNSRVYVSGSGIYGAQEIRLDIDDELTDTNYPVGPAQHGAIHPDCNEFVMCSSGGEITWFDAESGDVKRKMQMTNIHRIDYATGGEEVHIVGKWGSDALGRYDSKTGEKKRGYNSKVVPKSAGLVGQFRKFMLGNDEGEDGTTVHRQQYPLDAQLSKSGDEVSVLGMNMVYTFQRNRLTGSSTQQQRFELVISKLDAESGKKIASAMFDGKDFGFKGSSWIQNAVVHPEGSQFAVANGSSVYMVNADTGETFAEFKAGATNQIDNLRYSPGGRFLIASNFPGLWIWDTKSGEEVYSLKEQQGSYLVSFSKDDKRLAICKRNATSEVEVLDTSSWKKVFSREKTQGQRSSIALSDTGNKILFGLSDCRVELWDLAKIK